MKRDKRYPNIYILSKKELAKRISHKNFSNKQALELINDVINNFDKYWSDNLKYSEPAENKYVRNAKYTPLGILLEKINNKILLPYDKLLPNFIFGGIKGQSHIKAVASLIGKKRKRVLLKGDITHFFEQIKINRVINFFNEKCNCSRDVAKLLGSLCCIAIGPKGTISDDKAIARGFATSSRLAVWCNLGIFNKLNWAVKKYFKGHDPRLAIYVDDIGITASRIEKKEMDELYKKIEGIFEFSDPNQKLFLKAKKKKIISHEEGMEHLGAKIGRNKLSLGGKPKAKKDSLKQKLRNGNLNTIEKNKLKQKIHYLNKYESYVGSVN